MQAYDFMRSHRASSQRRSLSASFPCVMARMVHHRPVAHPERFPDTNISDHIPRSTHSPCLDRGKVHHDYAHVQTIVQRVFDLAYLSKHISDSCRRELGWCEAYKPVYVISLVKGYTIRYAKRKIAASKSISCTSTIQTKIQSKTAIMPVQISPFHSFLPPHLPSRLCLECPDHPMHAREHLKQGE